ncbi:MAG: response regulator [Thermoanaerobaculia bacterium]
MGDRRSRTLLVVDDEALFRKSVAHGLAQYEPSWRVLTAEDGLAARALLEKEAVDLVLTDLAMPGSDGFELLAYLAVHRPWIPVLVMTAFGTDQTAKRLRALGFDGFLEKPLDFEALVARVCHLLDAGASGFVRGISLPTFLQILELDGKSTRLRVSTRGENGVLYLVQGVLYDAETSALSGEAAATEIFGWTDVNIEMSELSKAPTRRIHASLRELLLDSARRRDERDAGHIAAATPPAERAPRRVARAGKQTDGPRKGGHAGSAQNRPEASPSNRQPADALATRLGAGAGPIGPRPAPARDVTALVDDLLQKAQQESLGTSRRLNQAAGLQVHEPAIASRAPALERSHIAAPASESSGRGIPLTEAVMVALESYLDELKGVRGYMASGILDFTGEALATHSANAGVKLEAVSAVFNDIFRGAHEASRKIGLDACHTLVMTTPKGIIVMECSGANKSPHLHAIAVLEEGGNHALAKMTISKILPQAVNDLT